MLLNAADYHHFEQQVLDPADRQYDAAYWAGRYDGPLQFVILHRLDRKVPGLHHHTLFFDADFNQHAQDIYETPAWPENPLFYVCAPSVTDPNVGPEGCENMFFLLPLAPDLDDNEQRREHYWALMCDRLTRRIGFDIRPHVTYRRAYAHREFKEDYNAYRGNAYGLANTLLQTAFLKPKLKSKKLDNLWYAGQLTTPGPGMPPSIISGEVAARDIHRSLTGEKTLRNRPVNPAHA